MAASFPTCYLFKALSPQAQAEKRRRGRCVSWGCKRKAEREKTKCLTCRSRLYRLKNDGRYAYSNLRASARKRGIAFDLSYEDFMEFCAVTGYLELRGKEPQSYSIDRERTDEGYWIGNIRILTYFDNVSHRYEPTPSGRDQPAEAGAF